MTAVTVPTLKPWPPVPDTLTAAQLLSRLNAPPLDERTAKRVRVTEVLADDDAKAAAARNAGGRYSHTLIIGEPVQQGGGR